MRSPKLRRPTLRRLIALECVFGLAILGGTFLANTPPAAADTFSAPGFSTEVVATVPPFTLVGLDFAPDGRLFVWQKNGVVRVIKNGVLLPTPFIDLSAKVNTNDDRGFWGLAFDPDFANNGYVYMTYTYENTSNPNDGSPKTSRLTRATANPANPDVALPGSEITILGSIAIPPCSSYPADADCINADETAHTIGTVQFASDGTLFVGIGDGAFGGSADPNALRAQDLNSYNGKILRINKDGTAPSDNPFYDGTNSKRSKVWLSGVRNPFRFTVQPGTGEIWFGDVGWNAWEEINRGVRGANYGWPCYEGAGPQPQFMSAFTQCQNLAASAVQPPFYTYNHSTGTAAIGGPFYTGTAYPQEYRGNFFFADYSGNFIKRVTFDANNQPVSVQPFATDVAAPVSMAVGPDGLIYYLSFTTGEIRRIRAAGPSAVASATPTNGYAPLSVTFSSAGTANPDGGPLTYSWNFGDGTPNSAVPNPSHTYTASGVHNYVATLTVTDSASRSSVATTTVTVGSTPPVPTITLPVGGTSYQPGQTVNYSGSATDPDDGALTGSALKWTVLLHHNTHVHTFVGSTGATGSFVVEGHGPVGTFSYEVILTATDSSGLSTSTSVMIPIGADTTPPTAPANLTANASGPGQVNLAWSASTDDVAVSSYRVERCTGAGCSNFAQLGAPATTSYVDTGLTASTTYRYRVSAVDASGNISPYSNIATAATGAGPAMPPGLVAGYNFDAGSGATAADVSGNGNTGTLNGATWTTGKYGGALLFNGGSSVSVPSSASLNVTSAMTLAAWIKPTATQSGWRTIMQKQTDAWALNASNSAGALFPGGGGTVANNWQYTSATSAAPVNAWTHVTMTYDGTTMRLYINGAQVASRAVTGAVQTTTSPLWIGGNSPYGEFFTGLIDEAQVYNRALSATEVQTVMNGPTGPPAPDTVAPSTPAGLTAVGGAGSVALSWPASTDNVGVTGYQLERCTGAGCGTFAALATPTATSYTDPAVAPTTTYGYRVRAVDAAGNTSGYSTVASATTTSAPDITAPTAPTGLTATAISTTRIDLGWTAATDNVGVTQYRVERCTGASCTTWAQVGTPTGLSFANTGLTAATTYRFRVRAVDAAGNLGPYSAIVSRATQAGDTTAPSAPTTLAGSASGPTQINLTWTASTDNVGVTGYRVERCLGASCTTYAEIGTTPATTFANTGLTPSSTYRFRVRANDAAGNLSNYSNVIAVTTPASPDTTPPTSPSNLTATVSGLSVSLAWTGSTDNVGVSGYRIDRCVGAGCSTFTQSGTTTATSFVDGGLAATTSYSYRVWALDAAGNASGFSNVATAVTGTTPVLPAGLVAGYSFNASSGTSVTDGSGHGNTGTVNGAATWGTGKYGGAMQFDGATRVSVPAAASLSITNGLTLAAWIKPTAAQSGWRTIMQRQTDSWVLNASNDSGALFPGGGGTIAGNWQYVSGPSGCPVNAWTHVAMTYDGGTMRLYVNGTQVATRTVAGTFDATSLPLWIGGNSPYGEYFTGQIDEAQVYNRALSAAEVTTVMNTPIG